MTTAVILAAAIPATIVGGLLVMHEVRRFVRERREARERVLRRIAEVREAVGSGVRHSDRFTLQPTSLATEMEARVSSTPERGANDAR